MAVGWPKRPPGRRSTNRPGGAIVLYQHTMVRARHVVSVRQALITRPEVDGTAPAGGSPFAGGPWNIGMRGVTTRALLSRTAGGIVQWKRGKTAMVAHPRLTIRPLTDNDRGCGHGFVARVLDDGWCPTRAAWARVWRRDPAALP